MRSFISIFLMFLVFVFSHLNAQVFFSNGADIFIANGAVVHVNGGCTIDQSSGLTNDGSLTITKNATTALAGTFTIDNASTAQGNGSYRVEQDWINNASFSGGNSSVELFGNSQQFITSTNGTITTFHNLNLTGTGTANNRKKTLQSVNANVDSTGLLNINDRELETQTQTFYILNPSVNAVSNNQTPGSEGFVSSIAPGTFARNTNSISSYLFPTGSSLLITRYRPIDIVPTAAGADLFTVRFVNNDANNDGYLRTQNDGILCLANDKYYHAILRPAGVDPADIRMYYIPSSDGSWAGMSHWRLTNTQWNDMAAVTPGASGVFTTMTRAGWLFANPGEPYILTDKRPDQPSIICPTVCENSTSNLFIATGGTAYQWSVPGNGTILSGQGTDSLLVDWSSGSGVISVVSLSANGCVSLPDSCTPQVFPAPNVIASASADTISMGGTVTLSAGGADSYVWNPSGNGPSLDFTPTNSGVFNFCVIGTNMQGCSDTSCIDIFVNDRDCGNIFIPKAFSPNDDNANDKLCIYGNECIKVMSFAIYDRWGEVVFTSTSPERCWDGTLNGKRLNSGVFAYYFNATLFDGTEVKLKGNISLVK